MFVAPKNTILTREDVLEKLSIIKDNDTNIDIVAANWVKFLSFSEKKIRFILEFPAGYIYKELIKNSCIKILQNHFEDVNISLVGKKKLNKRGKPLRNILGVKKIILILSGKGGVGKSTFAVNLAALLAEKKINIGLLDADIFGPSVAHMLGCHEYPKLNDEQKIIPEEKFGMKFVSMGNLLNQERATVWRGPMASKAILRMFEGVDWGKIDYLIVDMPPGTSDVHITIAENFITDSSIIVSTPQQVALLDAIKAFDMLSLLDIKISGMVKNMSFFVDSNGEKNYLFGENEMEKVANDLNVSILGEIPIYNAIRAGGDAGKPAVLYDKKVEKSFDHILQNIDFLANLSK